MLVVLVLQLFNIFLYELIVDYLNHNYIDGLGNYDDFGSCLPTRNQALTSISQVINDTITLKYYSQQQLRQILKWYITTNTGTNHHLIDNIVVIDYVHSIPMGRRK